MYRTPFASLRVPDIDDVNQPGALVNLAADIQYRTEANKSRVSEVKRRRGVYLNGVLSMPVPNSALTVVQWDSVNYDTDDYVNLSVSATNITVPSGVFLVTANIGVLSSAAINTLYVIISGTTYGTIAVNQFGPAAVATSAIVSLAGLFHSPLGETVTVSCYQVSGAAGSLYSSRFTLAKIGNL